VSQEASWFTQRDRYCVSVLFFLSSHKRFTFAPSINSKHRLEIQCRMNALEKCTILSCLAAPEVPCSGTYF